MRVRLHLAPADRAALVLLLLLAAPVTGQPAEREGEGGDQPGGEELQAEEIVVRAPAEQAVGPSVERVSREALECRGARSLSDALASLPALVSTTGGRGERTLLLRGFDQRQVLVMMDGVPFFIPYDGQVDLSVIPAEMIDHLTVVKGSGSTLFGPTGLGGAVNVVTRRPGKGPSVQAAFEADREGGVDLRAVTSLAAGPVGLALGGALLWSPGYRLSGRFEPVPLEDGGLRDNSDRKQQNAFARLRWELVPGQALEASGFYLSAGRGVPPSTLSSQARYWRFSEWSALGASLVHQGRYPAELETDSVFFVRLFDNLIDSYDDGSYSTQSLPRAFHSWYHDRMMGGRLRARMAIPGAPWGDTLVRLWVGAQGESHLETWVSGHTLEVTRTSLSASPEAAALLGQGFSLSLALQVEVEVPGQAPSGREEVKHELNPRLALGYEPCPGLSLQLAAARRSRFPTLKERFSSALGQAEPNPGLGAERVWHVGLDGAWRALDWLELQASLFDAEVAGLIARVPVGGGLVQLQNLGSARLLGAELALALEPWPWLEASLGYAYLHARQTDRAPPDDRLADRPAHKLSVELVVTPLEVLELSTQLVLAGPTPFQHPDTGRWGELGLYTGWDARLAYTPAPGCSLWLRVTNLLDLAYQASLGFPEPGLELFVGFRFGAPP